MATSGPSIITQGYAGLSGSVVTYGYGDNAAQYILFGDSGSIYGGKEVVILNNVFSMLGLADKFSGNLLNTSRWTYAHTGSGGGSVNNGLILTAGTTAGYGRVNSNTTFGDFDIYVRYSHSTDTTIRYIRDIVYVGLDMIAGSYGTRLQFVHTALEDGTPVARLSVFIDGSLKEQHEVKIETANVLRLRRVSGRINAYIGSQLVANITSWVDAAAYASIYAGHGAPVAPMGVSTKIMSFEPKLIVTFGGIPSDFVVERGKRVTAITPEVVRPGPVDVSIRTNVLTITLDQKFTYLQENELDILSDGVMFIRNDRTLRNSSLKLKGLRL